MTARHKARKRAVDVLFESEQRGVDALEVLALRQAAADPPVAPYAADLVRGVAAHAGEIDALIGPALSARWTLARLPAVDRAVLRVGTYELRFGEQPAGIAISEAVALASELSTDASPAYVNAVLGAIARTPAGADPEPAQQAPPLPVAVPAGLQLAPTDPPA